MATTLLPSEGTAPGYGGTPDLPKAKTPQEWAESRGSRSDALSQYRQRQ